MKSTDSSHDSEHSQMKDHSSSQATDITRRRFLATSAVGVAGLSTVGTAAAATDKHTLVIEGFGPTTPYSFTVGGNLEKSSADGASINSSDDIVAQSAHGAVGGGKDAYTFTGALYSFDFDRSNEINVTLDGEAAHVGERPDHTLLVEGFGPDTPYSFSTSGDTEKSGAYGASINESDRTNEYGVSGAVQSGKDAYTYDGELLSFDFDRDGEVRVTIDGKAAHVGQRPDRTITVVATGEYSEYEVEIDGSIRDVSNSERGQDTVSGNTVSGAVSGTGYDKFTCDGDIRSITYNNDDNPEVYSNYRRIV